MRSYCLAVLSIAWICCYGQVTFRIVQLPPSTPDNAEIYFSGNFEGWTGGQDDYKLEKDADSLYAITLPQMVGTIQFKFTRGSWASVEKGPNGEEIANRTYTFGGNGATVDITIHNWADLSGITSTASDNVLLLDGNFFMPQLNRFRKIWLYLPPGYDTSQQVYPVMYMHDGQNLFDDSTSFAGEWGVDETLNELFDETGFGLIVVGIENGGGLRIDEYSPWIHPQYGGGEGEAYVDFIAETLKPFIDSIFRTLQSAENTGLMGSSMGGLISHYGGIAESETFGRIGVFSPSFGLFDSSYTYTEQQTISLSSKFYFLAGGLEAGVASNTQEMINTMLDAGATEDQMQFVIDPQGMHNEFFWRNEFREAVEWLFEIASSAKNIDSEIQLKIYPNPASDEIQILSDDLAPHSLQLLDCSGSILKKIEFTESISIAVRDIPPGMYFIRITSREGFMIRKVVVK